MNCVEALLEEDVKILIEKAKEAREFSYSPYSNFMVGAALLTREKEIFTGCNIENAAYTPGNCAERTAIFKAVSEGKKDFLAIAIVGGARKSKIADFTAPCGVCRQVMAEFCDPEHFQIILCGSDDEVKRYLLKDLLPMGFGPADLKKN